MALVLRLFVHRHSKVNNKHDVYTLEGTSSEPHRLPPRRSNSLKQLFASRPKDANPKWVPTLSAIVKAGDEGLWSSTLFTNPHGHPGEVSFEAICEMFANELRPRSLAERSAYSGKIGKFINTAKRGATSPRRVKSMSHKRSNTGRGDEPTSIQGRSLANRRSLDISAIEKGLGRSLSVKRSAPVLVALGNGLVEPDTTSAARHAWMKEDRPAQYYDGRTGRELTSTELATLSVLLGSLITYAPSKGEVAQEDLDEGAFGISILSTPNKDDGRIISLQRHKRSTSQLSSGSSGHSPLFAKHLACGSLPFSQETKSSNTILISNETLEAVRSGAPLTMRKRSQQTPQAGFLAALPSSRELSFHALEASTKSSPPTPLFDAIAQLPFVGGLAPLASTPLISTVHFITTGGVHPGRLLQRLESLVDKLQRHSPHLTIFGPLHSPQNTGFLFRERERLARIATGAVTEDLADKVARMQRYTTLLQRMMALVPDMNSQDVLTPVMEATKAEILRSYANAVAAHSSASTPPSPVNDTHCPLSDARSSSRPSVRRSPRSSIGAGSSATLSSNPAGRQSITFPANNLGKQVEMLLKSELPFSVEMIAVVARLVIVAWTLSVGRVAWEDGEEGFRVPNLEGLEKEKMVLV
ncbi:hypothetical protein G6514_010068 [Epicoccum nigrum]|nr:hypothetical protein G6514_010068 [Epicoccum nigrum]